MQRANSKNFLIQKNININNCKISTSKMFERKDNATYKDNWWFKFDENDLKNNKYIIFCGALDYANINFKLFKVPASYVIDNLLKLDKNSDGWINIYLSFKDYIDLRNNNNLSFKEFLLN